MTDALSTPWTPQQVKILEQTLGSETVLEAVKRNELEVAGLLSRAGSAGGSTAASNVDYAADARTSALSSPNSSVGVEPAPGLDNGHIKVRANQISARPIDGS